MQLKLCEREREGEKEGKKKGEREERCVCLGWW